MNMDADTYSSLLLSLHELLSSGAGGPNAGDEDRNTNSESHSHHQQQPDDVYRQYLNSPPPNNTNTINVVNRNGTQQQQQKSWWKMKLERWLHHDAMPIVGVGSNANIIHFWRSNRACDDNDDGSMSSLLVDCRYMVWFVQNVLLRHLMMVNSDDDINDDDKSNDDPIDHGEYMIQIVEIYHKFGLQLLSKNSFAAFATTDDDDNVNNVNRQDEENGITNTAGVMWQMLLQNVNLTPEELSEYYRSYHDQRFGSTGIPPNDLVVLPYAWPSFFRYAAAAAAAKKQPHSTSQTNKRRRISSNNETGKDWWSLFGYFIGHVILSSSSSASTNTINNKVQYLKEYICTKLPIMMMNLGSANDNYNSNMKNSLLCGIVASVIDEIGEWTILDGSILDDIDVDNNNNMYDVNDISPRSRPSVGDIVELLLMDAGILSKLATLTRTRLANLVAEIADAILNYSIGSHRLRLHFNTNEDQDDNDDDDDDIVDNSAAVLYQQHVSRDADCVIHFIDKANPQLREQLLGRNFIPGQYNSNPPHPMVIYTRALISSNKNSSVVARLLRKLEDSTGIEYATKYHCYALFLESMQDRGVLFEDGWNDNNAQGGEATLANVTLGPIGRTCALEYMRNVILVAKENLLPLLSSHSSSRQVRQQCKRELSCVKDTVRRTVLKFCLNRPNSHKEALDLANMLSDAERFPRLDNVISDSVNGPTAEAVVIRILRADSLYSVYDGDINIEEQYDSIYEEEDEVIVNEASFKQVQESAKLLVNEPIVTDNRTSEHEANEQIDTERDNSSHFDDNKNEVIDLEDSHSSAENFSESDNYDNEEEEEEEEEREVRNASNEHQDDAIEILSSGDEEEEDNDDDEDEEDASSEEERNEALDTFGISHAGSIESVMQFKQYDQSVYKDDESSGEYSSYDNTTDTEGKVMADDEQADDEQSIDTEEDKRIFVKTSIDTEDEKRDGCQESLGERVDGAKYDVAPLLEDQPIKEFDEMKKGSPSVLVAAAISSQRLGNNPLYLGDVHSDSDEVDDENDNSTKVAEDDRHTDDGYAPDADATEEEDTVRIKKDSIRILDGYDPDAELTEEERQEKSPPKEEVEQNLLKSNDLTHKSNDLMHIDEGYLPDGTLTEEERVETFLDRNKASFKDASSRTADNDLLMLEDFFLPHDDIADDDHVASLSMPQEDRDDPVQEAVAASLGMQDMMEGEDAASLSMLQHERNDPGIQMRGPGRPKEEEDITALDIQVPIKKKPGRPKKSEVVAASSQDIMEDEDPADNHDESSEIEIESKPVSSRRKKQDASSTSMSTTLKSATTSSSVRKSGRRKSQSRKILDAASQDAASDSISAQQKSATSVSITRRSGGRKTQELQPDTPISKLSSVQSESDEDTVQSTETPGITQGKSSGHSVPATIVTRGNRGKKPSLAVVPEGQTVEDSTISATVLASETHHTDESDVKKMKVAELKEALQKRGLSTDGNKLYLQSRLLEAVISDDRDIPVEEEISSTTTSKRKSVSNPPKSKKKAKLLGDDDKSVSEKLSLSSRTRRTQPIVDDHSHSSDAKSGRYSIRSSSTKRTKARNVEEEGVLPKKRGPGRPKKEEGSDVTNTSLDLEDVVVVKKKSPGRPKKADKEKIALADETKREVDESVTSTAMSTRTGRNPGPPKSQNKKESMDEHDSAGPMPPSKKRGRPPKKPSSTETVTRGRSGPVYASGRGKVVDEDGSVASSRRSTRSVASKATDSTSMATRGSNKRAK